MFSAGRVERVLFTGEMPNKEAFSEEGVTKLRARVGKRAASREHGVGADLLGETRQSVSRAHQRVCWVKPAKDVSGRPAAFAAASGAQTSFLVCWIRKINDF